MNCADIRAILPEYLKGSLLSDAAREHLTACPDCRREFVELTGLWTALGSLQSPEPGRALRARVLGRRPWIQRHGLPAVAAVLLLAGGVALGLNLRRPTPVDPNVWSAAARTQGTLRLVHSASPADRMKGLALMGAGDGDLAESLLTLVEQDPDTQVRLAAVESLYHFSADIGLRSRLGGALTRQDRHEVQLALVDLIVGLRERRAVEALRRLGRDGKLPPDLHRRVVDGLAQLEASQL